MKTENTKRTAIRPEVNGLGNYVTIGLNPFRSEEVNCDRVYINRITWLREKKVAVP